MSYNVTGADIGPFLVMHPEAPLLVNIFGRLIPVRDVYYDNERGYQIIEVDQGALTWAATPQDQ